MMPTVGQLKSAYTTMFDAINEIQKNISLTDDEAGKLSQQWGIGLLNIIDPATRTTNE